MWPPPARCLVVPGERVWPPAAPARRAEPGYRRALASASTMRRALRAVPSRSVDVGDPGTDERIGGQQRSRAREVDESDARARRLRVTRRGARGLLRAPSP